MKINLLLLAAILATAIGGPSKMSAEDKSMVPFMHRQFEIEFFDSAVEAFAFTFG